VNVLLDERGVPGGWRDDDEPERSEEKACIAGRTVSDTAVRSYSTEVSIGIDERPGEGTSSKGRKDDAGKSRSNAGGE